MGRNKPKLSRHISVCLYVSAAAPAPVDGTGRAGASAPRSSRSQRIHHWLSTRKGWKALCFPEGGAAKAAEASGILLLTRFAEAEPGTGSRDAGYRLYCQILLNICTVAGDGPRAHVHLAGPNLCGISKPRANPASPAEVAPPGPGWQRPARGLARGRAGEGGLSAGGGTCRSTPLLRSPGIARWRFSCTAASAPT